MTTENQVDGVHRLDGRATGLSQKETIPAKDRFVVVLQERTESLLQEVNKALEIPDFAGFGDNSKTELRAQFNTLRQLALALDGLGTRGGRAGAKDLDQWTSKNYRDILSATVTDNAKEQVARYRTINAISDEQYENIRTYLVRLVEEAKNFASSTQNETAISASTTEEGALKHPFVDFGMSLEDFNSPQEKAHRIAFFIEIAISIIELFRKIEEPLVSDEVEATLRDAFGAIEATREKEKRGENVNLSAIVEQEVEKVAQIQMTQHPPSDTNTETPS